jgi:hypothetical protein
MITLILFAVIGAVLLLLVLDYGDMWVFEKIFVVFSGLVIGAFFSIIPMVIIAAVSPQHEEVVAEYKIVNIKDNMSVKRVGIMPIEGTMKYVFYYHTASGGYSLKMIDYTNASIRYSDTARVIKIKSCPSRIARLFTLLDGGDRYIIEVPAGTITTDFELNAE